MKVTSVTEKFLKGIWGESTVARIVRSLAVKIFVGDPMLVVRLAPFWIRQKFISLLDFNEFSFSFRMIRLVGMPKGENEENR
jgi:hypothetical protein